MVSTSGIGDVDNLLRAESVGVLVGGTADKELATAAELIFRMSANGDTGRRCKEVARERLSLNVRGNPAL